MAQCIKRAQSGFVIKSTKRFAVPTQRSARVIRKVTASGAIKTVPVDVKRVGRSGGGVPGGRSS